MNKINHQHKNLNIYWVSALAILIAISAPWFDISASNHSFVKSYIANIGVGILVLMILWMKSIKTQTTFHISAIKTTWLSLFFLGTISIFWSTNIDFTITKWFIWFIILCSFVVGYNLKLDEQTFIKISWGLLIATFLIAGIGILQYLFDSFSITQAVAPASTFGNKNMTTHPIVLVWPLALFLLFSDKTQGKKVWLISILTSLIMVFVFYTRTRSSWLSIAGETVLIAGFLLIKRKELKSWINWNNNKTVAILFSLGLFLVMINFNDQGSSQFWGSADGGANVISTIKSDIVRGNSRFTIWEVAIDMIKASPFFGTGLGTWFHNEMQGGFGTWDVNSYQRVHNDTFELGVEVGLVGILLLLISVIALVVGGLKIINKDHKTTALFYAIILAALSGSFIQMQFSFPYQLAMPAFLLGLYIGLIAKKSEEFVKPLKLITLKTSNYYHLTVKALWLIIMIVTSAIYIDWIHTYSRINQINKEKKFNQIESIIPTVYHLELQNLFSTMANIYLKSKKYQAAIDVDENIIKYWPNSSLTLINYARALIGKKRFTDALKVIKHLKSSPSHGNYVAHALEMDIYLHLKRNEDYKKAFFEFKNADEDLLKLSPRTYKYLIILSINLKETRKHTLDLYKKYRKYHVYGCGVEKQIADYYIREKQYEKAKQHADIIAKKGPCSVGEYINNALKQNGY